MANERIPNDPTRSPDDPYRIKRNDELRGAQHLDTELQIDPELAEGPANTGKIAMFAVAVALVLGAVFYSLNNSTIKQTGTSPAGSTAQNTPSSPPPAPAGMRDVTPRANTDQGMTTGAAPARPQTPPSSAPTGQDMNRSGNPPTTGAPSK